VLKGTQGEQAGPPAPWDTEAVAPAPEKDEGAELEALAGESYESPAGEGSDEQGMELSPLVSGEQEMGEEEVAAVEKGIPSAEEADENGFYILLNKGFDCLKGKDWTGARGHWERALKIRPQDKRIQANLRRLDKLTRP